MECVYFSFKMSEITSTELGVPLKSLSLLCFMWKKNWKVAKTQIRYKSTCTYVGFPLFVCVQNLQYDRVLTTQGQIEKREMVNNNRVVF